MPKKLTKPATWSLTIRADAALGERVVAHAERLKRRMPGVNVSQADAVRALLERALGEEEGEEKGGRK